MHERPPVTRIGDAPDHHDSLEEEIAVLEARLARLAEADDSAYEKALIRSYEHLIATRRAELARRSGTL